MFILRFGFLPLLVCFLFSFQVNAVKKTPPPVNNSAAEDEKTEMKWRSSLDASERCCYRQEPGGDAHGWSPQTIAEFLAGKDVNRPSKKTIPPGSSTGSQ